MKVTELRIGNYYAIALEDGIHYPRVMELKYNIFGDLESDGNNLERAAEPIPLTEEWLLRFGFSDKEYKNGYIGVEYKNRMIMDFALTKPKKMGVWQDFYCFDLPEHRITEVRYVHTLQNLFFSITGKELELRPTAV